ncbi:hypothetical protein FIBSPDRAFT_1038112 [Athelia psychrophila]|uniref:F-box domain-containing protein n=1 Tax=Athelia psychrophila TaxID=1759441 RepID=A0A166TQS8_9AGAM|nr:hypothetical protein FIBSPDRAFT_1038112 [Fibularhizoctonia sp. CBS 109695]
MREGQDGHDIHVIAGRPAATRLRSFGLLPAPGTPERLFVSGAPHLTNVELYGVYRGTYQLHAFLPSVSSVISLRLFGISVYTHEEYDSLHGALMSLKELAHLELTFEHFMFPSMSSHIVLPTIQFLHVGAPGHQLYNQIVGHIDAISLKALSLNGWDYEGPEYGPEYDQPHFPSLRHLILTDISTDPSGPYLELEHLARRFPDIECITCHISTVDPCFGIDDILASVPYWLGWPKLHTVAMAASRIPVNADRLLSMIIMLQESGLPMQRLLLPSHFLATVGEEATAMLKEHIEIEDFYDDWPTPFSRER